MSHQNKRQNLYNMVSITFPIAITAMTFLAIAVLIILGFCNQEHYSNYFTLQFPIMLALAAIPIVGVTGYFVNNALFLMASVICGLISIICALSLFSPLCIFTGFTNVVAGALAFVVTLAIAGTFTKDWHTIGLFCNLFTYFQIFCTGTVLLEILKNGLHLHSQ